MASPPVVAAGSPDPQPERRYVNATTPVAARRGGLKGNSSKGTARVASLCAPSGPGCCATTNRTGHGAGVRARSKGVGADDFTPAAGPQRPPDLLVDRVLDEPDGAVAHAHVDPAGVVALRRDGGGV